MTSERVRRVIDGCETDGLVWMADLRRAGVARSEVARSGHGPGALRRATRGLYLTRGQDLADPQVRSQVALAYAGPGALLTGLEAARLLGLRWVPETDARHVLVPADRRRESVDWLTVRRCTWWDELVPQVLGGLPLPPVAQVVVDAGREIVARQLVRDRMRGVGARRSPEYALRDVRGVVLGAVADGHCTVGEVRAVLERSQPAGTALVRRACLDAERGAVSPPEAELVDALLGRRVPFYVNCAVLVDGRLLGVADVWLLGRGVGAEMDSAEHHGSAEHLDATLLRDRRFTDAGLRLEHTTPARFRAGPDAFVDALLRSGRQGSEPPGLELRPRGPLLGAPPS